MQTIKSHLQHFAFSTRCTTSQTDYISHQQTAKYSKYASRAFPLLPLSFVQLALPYILGGEGQVVPLQNKEGKDDIAKSFSDLKNKQKKNTKHTHPKNSPKTKPHPQNSKPLKRKSLIEC